jgi:hypothetical protein
MRSLWAHIGILILASVILSGCQVDPENEQKEAKNFNFQKEEPFNGTDYGLIVLGSSGFDAFHVIIDQNDRWSLIDAQFGVSGVYDRMASLDSVKSGLELYVDRFENKGIRQENIHFLVSSSAIQSPQVIGIVTVLKQIGLKVKPVTVEEEGKYALLATLPTGYESTGFVIDMGSGNTKIAYYDGNNTNILSTYGSKFYERKTSTSIVVKELNGLLDQSNIGSRSFCFIIGGAPYRMSESFEPINEYYTPFDSLMNPENISNEQIRNGWIMLKTIVEHTGSENITFDRKANFSIGYILDNN